MRAGMPSERAIATKSKALPLRSVMPNVKADAGDSQ